MEVGRMIRSSRRLFLFAVMILLLLAFSWSKPVSITILHDNDVHGRLLPFFEKTLNQTVGGAARRASIIDEIRKKNSGTLVLTAGDWISGTPISGLFKGEADFKAIQLMKYDAMVIGNHEFDYGQETLRKFINTSSVPILCANLYETKTKKTLLPPYKIFVKNGLKIAVIGITTQETPVVTHPKNVKGLEFENPSVTLSKLIPNIRKKADIVLVLSHCGYQEDKELAKTVPGIDIIVGGHSHSNVLLEKVDNTLIVQDYQWGIYMGRLDFKYDPAKKKFSGVTSQHILISQDIPEKADVKSLMDDYSKIIQSKMDEKVGVATVDLVKPNYGNPDSNLAIWITEVFRKRLNADIAMQNTGGVRANISKGDVTYNDIYNVLPFENLLVLLEADGELMQNILDDLAQRSESGKETSTVTGVTCIVKQGKATKVLINGQPLDPKKKYTIAVNDFMANGGSGYSVLQKANLIKYDAMLRDIVLDELKLNPNIVPPIVEEFNRIDSHE